MLTRLSFGEVPEKHHTALRDAEGKLFYEEMHTRGGFGGPFTYFYHRYPITAHTEVSMTRRGFPHPVADEAARFPIRRRLYQSGRVEAGGQLLDRRSPARLTRPTSRTATATS